MHLIKADLDTYNIFVTIPNSIIINGNLKCNSMLCFLTFDTSEIACNGYEWRKSIELVLLEKRNSSICKCICIQSLISYACNLI